MAWNHRYPVVLMFGGPGSGKGTQGGVLGQFPNVIHLAMGDIFRALDKESDIGKEFLSYSTRGALVPDELTVRAFRKHVDDLVATEKIRPDYHTLILDGIPRTTTQVQLLADFIEVRKILHLVMQDRDALVARLVARAKKSNRPDDADRAVIEHRIGVYERDTQPVLDQYPKKLVARINADQPPLAVLRDIAGALVGVVPGNL